MMKTSSTPLRRFALCAGLASALAACGRDSSSEDFRLAGAGLNPDEIGPAPEPAGGLIEYNWVNFASSGLPLSLLGLASFTEVSPGLASFNPPYAAVTGFAYIFEADEPSPETLFGSWSPPPVVEGTCYTNYDPRSFISSLVDVGTGIDVRALDDDVSFRIGRRPALYGPNAESAFPIYFAFETWRNEALYYRLFADDAVELTDNDFALAAGRNFPHGELVELNFPGSLPPEEASFGAIPVPLASLGGNRVLRLPTRSDAMVLQWNGPTYDSNGDVLDASSEVRTTCFSYAGVDGVSAEDPTRCTEPVDGSVQSSSAQVFAGPWDTETGVVRFTYAGAQINEGTDEDPVFAAADERISVSVRFLGPLDPDDEYKHEYVVEVPPDAAMEASWDNLRENGDVPEDLETPMGRRPATSCDEDGEWLYDQSLESADGSPVLALNGEPSHRLAEVTCLLPALEPGEVGSFDLTMEAIQDAYDYALAHGAEGALFYVSRGTQMDLTTPPIRDAYGSKRETSPIKVVSNAVTLGRFHFEAQ